MTRSLSPLSPPLCSDFLQWGQLSGPYSSTDRSSSLGSMESLDAPTPTTQPYSDSCHSPVDPAVFNNKRDSAYSSFSASSNASDYAVVPLRPDQACSMDNLLQGLGPSCPGLPGAPAVGSSSVLEAQLLVQKSRSLTRPRPRPVEVKERPSSCCFDGEQRGGETELLQNGEGGAERRSEAPQPPTRKDSFRATRSRPTAAEQRCIESSGVSCNHDGDKPPRNAECGIYNGFAAPGDQDRTPNAADSVQRHTIAAPVRSDISSHKECSSEASSGRLPDPEAASMTQLASAPPRILPPQPWLDVQGQPLDFRRSRTKRASVGLHRHSAPEKLLATQLQLLQFACEPSAQGDTSEGCCRSSVGTTPDDQEPSPDHLSANNREGSRSFPPGSVFLEGDEPGSSQGMVNGHRLPVEHAWGRSVSAPADAVDTASQGRLGSGPIAEGDFAPLSTAASIDTLLEEQKATGKEGRKGKPEEGGASVQRSSRSHLRNRRRSERFATNLRNEIQRKKAQLQRSRGPGGLLCSGETVQEEDGLEADEEEPDPEPAPLTEISSTSVGPAQPRTATYPGDTGRSRSVQILDTGLPSFGVGIRVVEEPAPAGKARRWRWTPEHKLQPEPEPERGCRPSADVPLGGAGSQHGLCAFTCSSYGSSSSCSRVEESSILPFADRMKFFEETSKGLCSDLTEAKGRRQPELLAGGPAPQLGQRRCSFQGTVQQERPSPHIPVEGRRLSVGTGRERQGDAEREHAREREERLREMEMEKQEMEAEKERARLREVQLEREQEEKMRRWKEERQREMERVREAECVRRETERETKTERRKWREEDVQLGSRQDFYGDPGGTERIFQTRDSLQPLQHHPQAFHHAQTQSRAARSAFHPVAAPRQPPESRQSPPQGYTGRSYMATEVRRLLSHPNEPHGRAGRHARFPPAGTSARQHLASPHSIAAINNFNVFCRRIPARNRNQAG